jgi:hypothetical protein
MPPLVVYYLVRQQLHARDPGSNAEAYPPFAGVDEAELLTAGPAGPRLSPPHAVNVAATNMTIASFSETLLNNETKSWGHSSEWVCWRCNRVRPLRRRNLTERTVPCCNFLSALLDVETVEHVDAGRGKS